MSKGRSIRLFLVDGAPGGIITAEIMNWTGHVLFGPRSRLADIIKREEATRTGVYFLTGSDPLGGSKPKVYIGETDNVAKRLAQHNKDESKDFWESVCIVTSKDQNLTKGHARYLESQLITIARDAGRSHLENSTAPDFSILPEADISDMDYFVEQVRTVLPVLGLEFLKEKTSITTGHSVKDSGQMIEELANTNLADIHVFELHSAGVSARATLSGGELVVHEGSTAKRRGSSSWSNYKSLHEELVEQGILVATDDPNLFEFSESYAFKSPSAAASVIMATTRNGRSAWKVLGGQQTYGEWQEAQMPPSDADEGDE
ncbi:GIY-YIG nuclease family protein [Thalassospira xiamenensis]|uniref:GIY-YIG nuclease family protein n=1 Tax=Thalassospira xiamenensis TaxID=220697 RepID=UPI001FFFE60E|nr:GIY-YIG nuclease family protein [Thalassospira xiamenensis]MCK2168135.1 GIY-YIG nuclease family protein [Thalassospira xiamenensis]